MSDGKAAFLTPPALGRIMELLTTSVDIDIMLGCLLTLLNTTTCELGQVRVGRVAVPTLYEMSRHNELPRLAVLAGETLVNLSQHHVSPEGASQCSAVVTATCTDQPHGAVQGGAVLQDAGLPSLHVHSHPRRRGVPPCSWLAGAAACGSATNPAATATRCRGGV